jgi:amino acid adenylation domain-containing protein
VNHLLWQRVRQFAQSAPDRPAVRGDGRALSYGELWQSSGRLASFLIAHGIGRGHRVGMLLPKSPECVVTMLGILRAGATYVPVDPRAPASRQAYVLGNAEVAAVVATPAILQAMGEHLGQWMPRAAVVHGAGGVPSWLASAATVELDALPDHQPETDGGGAHEGDPAYILYTSGSTGQPKGVVVSHRNAITFVDWGIESFGISDADVLSNHAPHHFDLSVFDIYCALHTGAVVAIVPDRLSPFPTRLAEWIEQEGITVWYSVPSALVRLLMQGKLERFSFPRLRTMLFAGEPFPVKYLRDVMQRFPHAEFHNLFGPTETNVCTWYRVPRPVPVDVLDLPIGHVCANQAGVVLRDDGGVAGIGEEGELLIGGPGVMLGYWGLPERTAAVRVQNPMHADYADPCHRTGDRVRIRPDGSFTFLGRRDHMIKTRGYRVELGEVENAILAHPAVRTVGVVALPDDEVGNKLYAAVCLEVNLSLTHEELVPFLLERIARYAVPEFTLVLDELPLTSTGKLDRTGVRDRILAHLTTR